MANASGVPDPFLVSYDSANGIATNGDDARFGLGGLTQGLPGAAFGYSTGVYPASFDSAGINDLRVQAQTSPNMTTLLLPGNYVAARASHGAYFGAVTASQTVTHASNGSGNPRYDLVVLRTRDPGLESTTQSAYPIVIQGVPAATPTEPAATDGDVPLAAVLVRAGTSSILASDVNDRRLFSVATGGIYPKSAIDNRGGGYEGQYRDNGATNSLERFDNVSGWVPVASPAAWSNFTPVLYYGGNGTSPGSTACNLGTGSSAFGRYIVTGKVMQLNYTFNWGTSPFMGTGAISTTLPPGYLHRATGGETHLMTTIYIVSSQTVNYQGNTLIRQNSNVMWPGFPKVSGGAQDLYYYTVAQTTGTSGQSVPYVPGGYAQGGILSITGTIEIA